jgi:starch synthase
VSEPTGFVCRYLAPQDLLSAITRALDAYHDDPRRWGALVRRVMRRDFSWERSAKEYVTLYEKAREAGRDTQAAR